MATQLPANDGLPYGMRWERFVNSFEVLDSENVLIAQVCTPYGSIEDWSVYIAFPGDDDGTREFRFLGRYHFDSLAIATVQTLLPYIW